MTRGEGKSDEAKRAARQDELHAAVGELLGFIRADLGAGEKPKAKELDRGASRALPSPSYADKVSVRSTSA
jgi:hypothetical protein